MHANKILVLSNLKLKEFSLNNKLGFSIDEYCEAASLSRRTICSLWQRGEGPPRAKIGRRVIIPYDLGKAWLLDQIAV